ncbi:hypothetical protein ARTSIC4J27_584 [Pseudarthrobacter siccitolerans]|uniref:Uncharacterized protein n=1 Tax=Pseudarthrobacter siccitolerans TaxID=861266 RepID=A0A024GYE6_9MICC|nr:hypothetical protein [Pseudarthrobacter siccitolerans]CCQ44657.1 hypothetical protein ARTSIC4J27_584 [Pseudarthrobacter siccitolerans]
MAASNISHNTPAAGSITWTAFNIAYNGVGYPVPAGSTAGRFVWWEYRNGSPVVMTGDVLPELGPDDTVLLLNKGGIGTLLPETNVLDGSLIVEESILAPAIGAEQINGGHIEADAVQTKHLGAGSVTAEQLSVGTVSANLVANGSFEDFDESGSIIGWELSAMTGGVVQPVTGVASSGSVAIQFDATSTSANLRLRQVAEKFIPVSSASGRRWYVSARMGVGTATTKGTYLRVNWYDANRVYLSYSDVRSNGSLSTTFAVYEGQVTPPAAARFLGLEIMLVSPNVVTKMYVDEATVHEVLVSAHIGDGQISTPKLAAGSVTADKILVSDWTNYFSNPDFEGDTANGSPRGMVYNSSCRVKDISGFTSGNGSNKALEIDAKSGSNNDVYDLSIFPVKPGDQFYVRFEGRHLNTVGTGPTGLGFRTYDAKKAGVTWTRVADFGATKTTVFEEREGVYTVPDGTYFLQPWATFGNNAETTNKFYVDNVVIRRMAGGELIVDGAIDGMVITGATIQTAREGARIVLDETGLRGWDADNINYLTANADGLSVTGTLTAHGTGYDYENLTAWGAPAPIPTEMVVGGAAGGVGLIGTEQWPPPSPAKQGSPIPGMAIKPTGVDMYAYAQMVSRDGLAIELSSGIKQETVKIENGTESAYPNTLTVSPQITTSGKPFRAPKYYVNGMDLSLGEVQVWESSGSMPNAAVPVPRLGTLYWNVGMGTSSQLANPDNSAPGTLTMINDGVYDITFSYGQQGGVTGARNFIEIKLDGGDRLIGRASFNPGEDSVNCTVTGVKLTKNQRLIFEVYQNSGGSKGYFSTVRISRVAAPSPSPAWELGNKIVSGNLEVTGLLTVGGEARFQTKHAEYTTTGWNVAGGGAQWDSGYVTRDTARTTHNTFTEPGGIPGSVVFKEAGYYTVSLGIIPRGNPGTGWTRLWYSPNGENLVQAGNDSHVWETFLQTGVIYVEKDSYIRSQMSYQYDHVIDARWKIHKMPY